MIGSVFTGLPSEMIDFFLTLRFHNSPAFFEENRGLYQRVVQQPLRELAEALAPTMGEIDARLDTRPARVVSRIRRDTRFSHNKDPYRDHMWLAWRYAGEMASDAMGFYWEVSPDSSHWGFGYYGEYRPAMDRIRRRLLAKPGELLDLYGRCGVPEQFELQGNAYKRMSVPTEVPEALHPLYIKKGFYLENTTDAGNFDLLRSEALASRLREDFLRLAPLYRWMRTGLAEEETL
jgi:uncharacterized protein (TIGR02453 family)